MLFTYEEIDRLISEDMPLFDLTKVLLNIKKSGKISFYTRKDTIVTANTLIRKISRKT